MKFYGRARLEFGSSLDHNPNPDVIQIKNVLKDTINVLNQFYLPRGRSTSLAEVYNLYTSSY